MPNSSLSLFELNTIIKNTFLDSFPETYWVIAEISDIKINRRGHCYLELIEKKANSEELIAKSRATIWANVLRILKPYFETSTGHTFSSGLKILVNVTIEYHEVFGLSLNIHDIEPQYTIGDLAKQKQETLNRLEKEGVLNMNKELNLPLVPQKIAIISSDTAAGYKDFVNQLENNPFTYKFYHRLFPSIMQGDEAEKSIITSLERIFTYQFFFDAVVIIRGGGAKSDLHCFNNYWLAYTITQFPIPVITGIGHEQDETITDIVAFKKLKTPTAVAEFLINRVNAFESKVFELQDIFITRGKELLNFENNRLLQISQVLHPLVKNQFFQLRNTLFDIRMNVINNSKRLLIIADQNINKIHTNLVISMKNMHTVNTIALSHFKKKSENSIHNFLALKKYKIEMLETSNRYLDPQKIVNRGYSLTFLNGKIVKDASILEKGDTIHTQLKKGRVESKVSTIKEK